MASEPIKKSVGSAGSSGRVKAYAVAEDLAGTASEAASEAGDRLGKVAEVAGDLYAKAANQASDALDAMPASLSDVGAAGEHLVRRGRRRLNYGVRKQPAEALLLAGAIGYLVGWATSRS